MRLSSVIFTALTGTVLALGTLMGNWMTDVNRDQSYMQRQLSQLDSHYAQINQKLDDLSSRVTDLQEMVREQRHGKR